MDGQEHQRRAAEGGRGPRQIKSRQRVRDLAEVYTHEREVNAMLDLVPDMFPCPDDPGNTDRTFLEPSCGSGNFLVEILRRKLRYVTPRRYANGEDFEHRILRCVASVYGIDISADNVDEARERMRSVIVEHLVEHAGSDKVTPGFREAVPAVLETNVICGDALVDAAEIELVEYRSGVTGTFVREWFPLHAEAGDLNLFSRSPRRDERPLHYSELARQAGPVRADSLDRAA